MSIPGVTDQLEATIQQAETATAVALEQTAQAVEIAQAGAGLAASATARTAPSSTRSAASTAGDHRWELMRDNFDLLFKRTDQQGRLLEEAASQLQATNQQMRQTLELLGQVIAASDEIVERLGDTVLALVRYAQEQQAAAEAQQAAK